MRADVHPSFEPAPPPRVAIRLSAKEARVLRVMPESAPIRHGEARALARMDTSTCSLMLRRLRAMGLIDGELCRRGVGNGSGAPATVYRLTPRGLATRGGR